MLIELLRVKLIRNPMVHWCCTEKVKTFLESYSPESRRNSVEVSEQ